VVAACGEARLPLLPVMIEMMPGRVFPMLGCVQVMGVRQMSVMSGLMVVARVMMLCCLSVVMGRHAVMMGCLAMFVRCLL
jgi:hypothetical protein